MAVAKEFTVTDDSEDINFQLSEFLSQPDIY